MEYSISCKFTARVVKNDDSEHWIQGKSNPFGNDEKIVYMDDPIAYGMAMQAIAEKLNETAGEWEYKEVMIIINELKWESPDEF